MIKAKIIKTIKSVSILKNSQTIYLTIPENISKPKIKFYPLTRLWAAVNPRNSTKVDYKLYLSFVNDDDKISLNDFKKQAEDKNIKITLMDQNDHKINAYYKKPECFGENQENASIVNNSEEKPAKKAVYGCIITATVDVAKITNQNEVNLPYKRYSVIFKMVYKKREYYSDEFGLIARPQTVYLSGTKGESLQRCFIDTVDSSFKNCEKITGPEIGADREIKKMYTDWQNGRVYFITDVQDVQDVQTASTINSNAGMHYLLDTSTNTGSISGCNINDDGTFSDCKEEITGLNNPVDMLISNKLTTEAADIDEKAFVEFPNDNCDLANKGPHTIADIYLQGSKIKRCLLPFADNKNNCHDVEIIPPVKEFESDIFNPVNTFVNTLDSVVKTITIDKDFEVGETVKELIDAYKEAYKPIKDAISNANQADKDAYEAYKKYHTVNNSEDATVEDKKNAHDVATNANKKAADAKTEVETAITNSRIKAIPAAVALADELIKDNDAHKKIYTEASSETTYADAKLAKAKIDDATATIKKALTVLNNSRTVFKTQDTPLKILNAFFVKDTSLNKLNRGQAVVFLAADNKKHVCAISSSNSAPAAGANAYTAICDNMLNLTSINSDSINNSINNSIKSSEKKICTKRCKNKYQPVRVY